MRAFLLTLAACAVCAVAAACSPATDNTAPANTKAGNTNAPSNTAVVTASPATTTASPAAGGTTSSAGSIGVAECDEYLTKLEACVKDKVPANMRASVQTSLDTNRKAWQQAAANPTTKGTLAQTCKTVLDAAKTSMKGYGCDF